MEKYHLIFYVLWLLCISMFYQDTSAATLRHKKAHAKTLPRYRRQWEELFGTDSYDYSPSSDWKEWGSDAESDFPQHTEDADDGPEVFADGVFTDTLVPFEDPFPNIDDSAEFQEKLPQPKEVSATNFPSETTELSLQILNTLFDGFRRPHDGIGMRIERRKPPK